MKPTLRQLEAFAAVSAAGSFGAAAVKIHASPSATSALIKGLESLLSVKLFDRTTRRVQLTQAGEAMREPAMRAMAEVERAVIQARAIEARETGIVRIAAPPQLMAKLVVPVKRLLHQRFPGLQVQILDVAANKVEALLRTDQADLGVGAPPGGGEPFRVLKLLQGPFFVLMPRKHALAKKRSVPVKSLEAEPLVLQARSSPLRDELDALLTRHGIQPRIAAEAAQLGTLISLVQAGFGLSVMPCYSPILENVPGTVARPLHAQGSSSQIVLFHEAERSLSPAAQSFIEEAKMFIAARVFKATRAQKQDQRDAIGWYRVGAPCGEARA